MKWISHVVFVNLLLSWKLPAFLNFYFKMLKMEFEFNSISLSIDLEKVSVLFIKWFPMVI